MFRVSQFKNLHRILSESIDIISKTKNLDTLRNRRDLCISAHEEMVALNTVYQIVPPKQIPLLDNILSAINKCEAKLILAKKLPSSKPYPDIPITDPVDSAQSIFNKLHALSPYGRGMDARMISQPEYIDQAIACYEEEIEYYHHARAQFISKGHRYELAWERVFDHCHNSQNPDFRWIDHLQTELSFLKENRDIICNFDSTILAAISENPGILQKDLPTLFHSRLKERCLSSVRLLAASGKISRKKVGRAYSLYIAPEATE